MSHDTLQYQEIVCGQWFSPLEPSQTLHFMKIEVRIQLAECGAALQYKNDRVGNAAFMNGLQQSSLNASGFFFRGDVQGRLLSQETKRKQQPILRFLLLSKIFRINLHLQFCFIKIIKKIRFIKIFAQLLAFALLKFNA